MPADAAGSQPPPILLQSRRRWADDAPPGDDVRALATILGLRVDAAARAQRLPVPAVVVVTDNVRTMLSVRRREGRFELRVCWRLLDRPEIVSDAVLSWLTGGRFGPELGALLAEIRIPDRTRRRARSVEPIGKHRDLAPVLRGVARLAGEAGAIAETLHIGWSRRGRARRSLRLGSALPEEGLIRVHPALDDPHVPEYVLGMVVYHELCHCIVPPLTPARARALGEPHRVHHSEFRALEARFPDLERANRWVRDNFRQLLRY